MKEQTLVAVLLQVFKDTEFKFAIDDQLRVFVTSDQALITQLPSNLFDLNDKEETDKNTYVAPTTEEQDKLLSTAESKLYNISAQRQRITRGKIHPFGIRKKQRDGRTCHWSLSLY